MIGIRKLSSLPDGTRMRKSAALVGDFEKILASGGPVDWVYWDGVLRLVADDGSWPLSIGSAAAKAASSPRTRERLRSVNSLRHAMLTALGRDWADWDRTSPGDDGRFDPSGSGRGTVRPMRVYLDGLRSPFNVGSILRTSLAFGVERLWASPDGAPPGHARSKRSSMGASEIVPWEIRSLGNLASEETGDVFALELGGAELSDFDFPRNGTVVLGSEELGVSPEALELAEASGGIVSIGMPGPKASLNVGVAFGILMHEWSRAIETRGTR